VQWKRDGFVQFGMNSKPKISGGECNVILGPKKKKKKKGGGGGGEGLFLGLT
jgi:hypothetical protein